MTHGWPPPGKRHWLDQAQNVNRIYYGLVLVCVVLVLLDLGHWVYDKHAHFGWENLFGFYGFFGFAAFFLAVLAGKQLRKILMRREDYYDQ